MGFYFTKAGYLKKPEFSVLKLTIPVPLYKFLSETKTVQFEFQAREDKTVSLSV